MKYFRHQITTTRHNGGFTLIELLVVVSIIGVLTALLIVNLVGARERAADSKRKSDLNQLQTAMQLYYNDNQGYPATGTVPAVGADWTVSGVTYMKEFPEYSQYVSGSTDEYYACVELDNEGDPDADSSRTRCNVISGPNDNRYCVCN